MEYRYFNAINLTYSPHFLRGLSLGMNRMFQRYGGDGMKGGSFMQDYIPVLSSIFKNSAGGLGLQRLSHYTYHRQFYPQLPQVF